MTQPRWWPPLAWAAFIVYGSLVPLEWRPMPLDEAWARFRDAPFLRLGIESRADWIANGVLYVPLGFLWVRVLAARGGVFAGVFGLMLCVALALAVEFTQLFFPPRTVSLNDLMAEAIGATVGALAVPLLQPWAQRLKLAAQRGGHRLAAHLLEAYAAGYLLLCFFPYDFVLNAGELAGKLGGGLWAWGLVTDRGLALALLQLAVEAALVAPLGWMLARRWGLAGASAAAAGALAGALLGVVVEAGQLLLASGVSQGASVFARAAGVAAGALAAGVLAGGAGTGTGTGHQIDALRRQAARWAPWVVLPYLLLLVFAAGWFRGRWHGWDGAVASWAELRWVPFYYHYWTTEAVALFSAGAVSLMFLPLAALGWVRSWPRGATLAVVAVTAAVVEAGKLFVTGQRPDPTNVPIALGAAAAVLALLDLATRERAAPPGLPASAQAGTASAAGWPSLPQSHPWPAVLAVALALGGAALFPVLGGPLALALLSCALLAAWRPVLAVAMAAAAMPLLDLAPWSGRMFWTEFDLLLLAVFGAALARGGTPGAAVGTGANASVGAVAVPVGPAPATGLAGLFALLGLSLAASVAMALWLGPGFSAQAVDDYHGAWNTLRVAKGALWAAATVWTLRRLAAFGAPWPVAWQAGMLAGLAGTVAWVLWERVVFVGLFDFAAEYRVTGPFSAMHRGGAFIECYLALGAAFALHAALAARHALARAGAALLLAATAYAVMVTFSRNGYAALAVALLAGLGVAWRQALAGRPAARAGAVLSSVAAGERSGPRAARRWPWAVAAVGLALAAALPVLGGPFARERLARSVDDLAVRQAHWVDALQLRSPGLAPLFLGEGLGRFPELHFWRSREPARAARYAVVDEGGKPLLRLGPGARLYLEQVVAAPQGQPLTVTMALRSPRPQPALTVALCEKSMLTSRACVSATLRADAGAGAGAGTWQRVQATLDTTALRGPPAPWGPQVKLALFTPGGEVAVDVAAVSLRDGAGREWLANGDFGAGTARWWFATDVDPPWHVHSLPVAVWLEQGALGALAWTLLLAGVGARAAVLAWQGRAAVPAAAPAAAAFLASGLLNTLIDEPRFLWLLLLLLWMAALPARGAPGPSVPASAPARGRGSRADGSSTRGPA